MTPQELRARTYRFALQCLRLFQQLSGKPEAEIIGRQLLRASTGAAANYRAAGRGRSRREFAAKLGVVVEECDECVLWLSLLIDGGIRRDTATEHLRDEARELTAIFAASWRTAKRGTTDAGCRESAHQRRPAEYRVED